jgi:hypothetical protein
MTAGSVLNVYISRVGIRRSRCISQPLLNIDVFLLVSSIVSFTATDSAQSVVAL